MMVIMVTRLYIVQKYVSYSYLMYDMYKSSQIIQTPRDIEKNLSYKKFDLSKPTHCHPKLQINYFLFYHIVKQFSNLCLICLPCYLLL